jgi:thiosulfate/3-mercaptopyruvate sulfurtransferase
MSFIRRCFGIGHTDPVEVRIVDCREREAYLAGHVPGAAFADPERDLTGTEGGGRHPLPTAEAFAAWASKAGIGTETPVESGTFVVAYDEGTGWAARLWWLLRHFGHDGAGTFAFAAWRGPLRTVEEQIEPREFVACPRTDDIADADELLRRLDDPSLVLVDARAPERFRGEVEPIDKVAGRIPGARNHYFAAPLPLPSELLEADDVVVYCGSGVTACVDVLALSLAGRDARLYPGSWSEWFALGNPVERG